jgi:predicted porin
MRTKLIALAVAGACASPAAMAQLKPVPGFEWSLYGRVYLTGESVEAKGGTTPVSRRNRVSDNSSLVGVRAEKALGGGLRGWGQLETGFAADTEQTSFATRNSAVGLTGSFGNVFLGRWDMPFKISQVAIVDPFGDLTIADITGVAIRQGGFSNRANNVVQYWTPKFGGFEGKVAATSNEGKSDATGVNPSMFGFSVEWSSGPAYVAYGYEKHKDSTGNVSPSLGVDETGHGFAGKYTTGPAELMAQYGTYKRTGTEDQKSYSLGTRVTFGVHQLLAAYRNSQDGGATGPAQPECNMISVGYRYFFDRNLDLIVLGTRVNNKTGALCNFGSNTLSITDGQDPQGFGAGFRYVF